MNQQTKKADVQEIIADVCTYLNEIIIDFLQEFRDNGNFFVDPPYGNERFYLDSVRGSYDESLYGLIHHIMANNGLYDKFLNPSQLQAVKRVVINNPEAIYGPNMDEDDYEEIQYDYLDVIYEQAIDFVENKLTENGFDVKSAFHED